MRNRKSIMIVSILTLLLFSLTSCEQKGTCAENVIITDIGDAQEQLENIYKKEDFYDTDESQYYMFEIVVDKSMSIVEIKTIFFNNEKYVDLIESIIKTFEFKLIKDSKSCVNYSIPFIINARLRSISYPANKDYFEVEMPIE